MRAFGRGWQRGAVVIVVVVPHCDGLAALVRGYNAQLCRSGVMCRTRALASIVEVLRTRPTRGYRSYDSYRPRPSWTPTESFCDPHDMPRESDIGRLQSTTSRSLGQLRGLLPLLSEAVHLATVANGEDENYQDSVVDLVDDAVVAGAHAPLTVPSDKLLGASWAGLLGKQFNDSLNPALSAAIQLTQLTGRRRAELDLVGHASPRSALTSSQGMVPCFAISARASSAASMSARSSAA